MPRNKRGLLVMLIAACVLFVCTNCLASGPRWVTGPPFFTGPAGVSIGWRQTRLAYFTDPGSLSATVDHQASDALVAAAASVWNVPQANITIAQGGTLAEHVSGQNAYLDSAGMNLPADVSAANAAAIPLAIIYDTDGSVTDTLFGVSSSDAGGCRQNAVTESVDAFDPAGYILHALIIINGRCTGTAPELQLQLQYQLMRAFGRVLGLAWSQTNDNVFTGNPTPTNIQAQNWPIMHPIDLLCGLYSYQCLPNPFQLRTDDISGLVSVYPVLPGPSIAAGKEVSLTNAQSIEGWIAFPTGQGMAGVNILVRRESAGTTVPDAFYVGSTVSGMYFRRGGLSPFVSASNDPASSFGSIDQGRLGYYVLSYFPMLPNNIWENLFTSTEPVNPLYTGEYSLGPYAAGNVAPAGSAPPVHTSYVTTPGISPVNFNIPDAPAACGGGGDGTPSAAAAVAPSGWWQGLLCGYGHASYLTANVKPGRTFTLEVTALDEQGFPTEAKAMPVIGLYASTDAPGALPSLAVAATAFNSLTAGTTTLSASTDQATSIRFGIADQRGDGRPDFAIQGRLFYADQVSPARIAVTGGTVTITGSGFRTGNAVTINGAPASVVSWTASEIVLKAPTLTAAGASSGVPVDVVVSDHGTGATTTIGAALTYDPSAGPSNTMRLVSAPSGTVLAGDQTVPFAVQIVGPDGVTPVVGETVVVSATAGNVLFAACGAATCTLTTDASGLASTAVTPISTGSTTLQAQDGLLSQSASFAVAAQASSMLLLSPPESPLRQGTPSRNWFSIQVLGPDGHSGLPFRLVTFSVLSGNATFAACSTSVCTVTTDQWGLAGMSVTPLSVGAVTIQAADGDMKQIVSFVSLSSADTMQITSAPSANVYAGDEAGLFSIHLVQGDGVSPDPLRTVTYTAPDGIDFELCGSNVCTVTTNWSGDAALMPIATKTGTFTLQAAYGSLVQTVTITATTRIVQLNVLSAPADNSPTGVPASSAFAVQLFKADGVTPVTGVTVTLSGPPGVVTLPACGYASCEVKVDARGVASTPVIPLQGGPITLSATYSPLVRTATFVAAGQGKTIRFVNQPGSGGAPIGIFQTLTAQVIQADGTTPMLWDAVVFSVVSGPFSIIGAATTNYTTHTDSNGMASCGGIATGFGPVVVQVTDGQATQLLTFNAGGSPDIMRVLSSPVSQATVGSATATPFSVQLFTSDGVTPASFKNVTFTVTNGAAAFGACPAAYCVVQTNADGIASTTVIPAAAGTVGLLAADGAVAQPVSFIGLPAPDILQLLAAPPSSSYSGIIASTPFSLRVFQSDGVTVAVGKSVTISALNNAALLTVCAGASSCTVQTDAAGGISTTVLPLAAGMVILSATDSGVILNTSFNVISKPDILTILSAPANGLPIDVAGVIPFSVQLLAGDGITPRPGTAIVFSSSPGTADFNCGGPVCTVFTDGNGIASSAVTPLVAGNILLTATENGLSQSVTLQALANQETLTAAFGPIFLAEGTTLNLTDSVSAIANGMPGIGLLVHWAATTGTQPALQQTMTDTTGASSVQVEIGPLAGGTQTSITACAWANICAAFGATGVSASAFQVGVLSGGEQSVAGSAPFAPIVLQVTDAAGHLVANAPLTISQTVTALDLAICPSRGRCPAAPVLLSRVTTGLSDRRGQFVLTPLSAQGAASQTEIVVSTGTQGFASTLLTSQP